MMNEHRKSLTFSKRTYREKEKKKLKQIVNDKTTSGVSQKVVYAAFLTELRGIKRKFTVEGVVCLTEAGEILVIDEYVEKKKAAKH